MKINNNEKDRYYYDNNITTTTTTNVSTNDASSIFVQCDDDSFNNNNDDFCVDGINDDVRIMMSSTSKEALLQQQQSPSIISTTTESSSSSSEDSIISLSNSHDDDDDENHHNNNDFHYWKELLLLLQIVIPMVGIQVMSYIYNTQTASAVGRILGTDALGGYSLGNLTISLSLSSIIFGSLSATETLLPRAHGMKKHNNYYKEMIIIALRGILSTCIFIIPTILLFYSIISPKQFYIALGQNITIAQLASQFFLHFIFLGGIPILIVMRLLIIFLSSQEIVMPLLYGMTIASMIGHPILIQWFLINDNDSNSSNIEDTKDENNNNNNNNVLDGAALVLVLTQAMQIGLVLIVSLKGFKYCRNNSNRNNSNNQDNNNNNNNCFLLSSWLTTTTTTTTNSDVGVGRYNNNNNEEETSLLQFIQNILYEVIQQPNEMLQFCKLSLGGVLSMTEWWFWELVCFLAGTIGVNALCVHTIPYNIVFIIYMIPLGIGNSLTIRIGNILPNNIHRAKQLTLWYYTFTICIMLFIICIVYITKHYIITLFTNDNTIIEGCYEIWFKVCCYIFFDGMYAINTGIVRALGIQWKLAQIIIICLFCITFPIMYIMTEKNNNGIHIIWTILPTSYCIMNIWLIIIIFIQIDWEQIQYQINYNNNHNNNDDNNKNNPEKMILILTTTTNNNNNNNTQNNIMIQQQDNNTTTTYQQSEIYCSETTRLLLQHQQQHHHYQKQDNDDNDKTIYYDV